MTTIKENFERERVKYKECLGTFFKKETPDGVCDVLSRYVGCSKRLRLFLGDAKTGKAWPEESDVVGRIGRSMGPLRVPLLLANARSSGGGAILDHCIVRIQEGQRVLYSHPLFDYGLWVIKPATQDGYAASVHHDGKEHALFHTKERALNYVLFMQGRRMSK